jgi:hypothetical protein
MRCNIVAQGGAGEGQSEANNISNNECASVIVTRMNRIDQRCCLPRHYDKDVSLCHYLHGVFCVLGILIIGG